MSHDSKFDDVLFAVLNHVGGIDKFLNVMFSFLYRRTDFFTVKNDSSENLGLPPGIALKMVKTICQNYVQQEKRRNTSSASSKPSPAEARKAVKTAEEKPSQKGKHVVDEVDSTIQNPILSKHESAPKGEETSVKADGKVEEKSPKAASEAEEDPMKATSWVKESPMKAASETESPMKTSSGAEESPMKTSSDAEERAARENEEAERRYYASNPECYNGASYDNYSWSQNIYELDIQVKVPNGVKHGNQVKVDIKRSHLRVEVFQDEKWQVCLDGKLSYEVKREDSTWTLHPHDHIHVQLGKGYERYWEALLEGEPKINVRTIDCSKPYEDLEPEAQAKLQEMMFDQNQKRLGKPTSQQMKVQEILKKSWNNNNSPFEGQKFDPSLWNMAE